LAAVAARSGGGVLRACDAAVKCGLRRGGDAWTRVGERAEAAALPRRDKRGQRLRRRATLRVEGLSRSRDSRCAMLSPISESCKDLRAEWLYGDGSGRRRPADDPGRGRQLYAVR